MPTPLAYPISRARRPARDPVFLADVLAGLRSPRKTLPCKYFYDERGSALFERICDLEEYYPTRTELAILRAHGGEMADALGPACLLVEYGSGSSAKTRLLLDRLARPAGYVPVDISREHLLRTAERLRADYPRLPVLPVAADFTAAFALPRTQRPARRRVVYFPGSTIGNFGPREAVALLRGVASLCGHGGGLLIGIDLRKQREVLERAYDDALGVTAAFNLNLLARINRELGADFDLARFAHRALWRDAASRIEMHLVSREEQRVRLAGETFQFRAGETICTEHSHKYTVEGFGALAARGGLAQRRVWTDAAQRFSVQYLEVA
jgi:dimethylhistidine N-methyltransferase